ncbi:MAG: hypothetical protein FWC33_01065 [Candidatus Bathyarchaeota archaeon]|nr:hypothetical protein [Candidatus Termiticorpusculum sp.]
MTAVHVCKLFTDISNFRLGFKKTSSHFETMSANKVEKWNTRIYCYHWHDGSFCEKVESLILNFFEEAT